MAFTRKFLTDLGIAEDVAETILSERSRTLQDYILKTDAKTASDTAVADALKNQKPIVVAETEEYKKLDADFQTFKKKTDAKASDVFKSVKGKFFDTVYEKLDHSKDYAEQLKTLKTEYEEYFNPDTQVPPAVPPVKTTPGNPPPQFSTGNQQGGGTPTAEEIASSQFKSAFLNLPHVVSK